MPLNIENYKIKKIENVAIPVEEIKKYISNNSFMKLTIHDSEDYCELEAGETLIFGYIKDGYFIIDYFDYFGGEFSGSFYEIFVELLKKSKGKLEMVIFWEYSIRINRLIFNEGEVEQIEVEI